MSRNANKRHRYQMEKPRRAESTMTAEELAAWHTGYSDKDLIRAAMDTGILKGRGQKSKREKLKHGIRYGDGSSDSSTGHRIHRGKADTSQGTFNGPLSVKDEQRGITYRYAVESGRITSQMGENGRYAQAFVNSPSAVPSVIGEFGGVYR